MLHMMLRHCLQFDITPMPPHAATTLPLSYAAADATMPPPLLMLAAGMVMGFDVYATR